MRSLLFSALLGTASLGLIGLTPAPAKASWLSEALHSAFDPGYYNSYYYAPAYEYPPPVYYEPGVTYYQTPYYVPYRTYGPRYYGHYGYPYHARGWNTHHAWHGGHEHHHR